jgi:ABC-type Fe3+/spermidine/putrescine transport system ATPase subunit
LTDLADNPTMLELKGLRKVYREKSGERGSSAERWLADGLDLVVAAGETVAVLGASGSGKSTLLKMIAGLEAPDAGSVWFGGVNITRTPPEERRFALIFQDFALFPNFDVRDNVAFGLLEQGLNKAESRKQALAMLSIFGLSSQAQQRVWTLSGGEQQRVALARALIIKPRLLLLDEPFSALDAELRTSLRNEFTLRIAEAAIPALLVTHDENEAREMAQSGFRLFAGQLQRIW